MSSECREATGYSPLNTQNILNTLSNPDIVVVDQLPLPPTILNKAMPLNSNNMGRALSEPCWHNVNKKVMEKYNTERKQASKAIKDVNKQNYLLNKIHSQVCNYSKITQSFIKQLQRSIHVVDPELVIYLFTKLILFVYQTN